MAQLQKCLITDSNCQIDGVYILYYNFQIVTYEANDHNIARKERSILQFQAISTLTIVAGHAELTCHRIN